MNMNMNSLIPRLVLVAAVVLLHMLQHVTASDPANEIDKRQRTKGSPIKLLELVIKEENLRTSHREYISKDTAVSNRTYANCWQPKEESLTQMKYFNFDQDTGRLSVNRKGYYSLHASVMISGGVRRRALVVYVNDNKQAEALDFPPEAPEDRYTQLQLTTIVYLQKNDNITLQIEGGFQDTSEVVPSHALTHWSIFKHTM